MDLDDQSVCSGGNCGAGKRRDKACHSGGVAGVNDDRQMGEFFHRRDHGNIQRVAGVVFKSPDAAFAEHDIVIAAGHDVFGAHQEFLIGRTQSPLEQDRFTATAELFEQFEVLHIAGTDLDHIDFSEEVELGNIHDFGHDRQSGIFTGLQQQFDTLIPHSLEAVRRSPGFERSATEHGSPGTFNAAGDGHDLRFTFNGTGTGDHTQTAVADRNAVDIDDGIQRVKFTVGAFKWLLNAADVFNDLQLFDHINVNVHRVANQPENGVLGALTLVNLDVLRLDPTRERIELPLVCVVLQNDNPFKKSPILKGLKLFPKKKLRNVWLIRYGVCNAMFLFKVSNHCTANPASKVKVEAEKVNKVAEKQRHIVSFNFVYCT